MKTLIKISAPIFVAMVFLAMPGVVGAVTLTMADANGVGYIEYGIPSGDQDREDYVNFLITMSPGTNANALGQNFFRSTNVFSPMLTAVFAHNSGNSGGGNLTNVNTGIGGFMYLFAKYDGPNYGSVVWCIAGMTGMITIPATANGYGLSGWTLFSPGIPTQQVPEGGSALALLGLALVGIEGLRRKLRS